MRRLSIDQARRYALAAQGMHGDVQTDAYYWFVTEKWGYELKGYPITEARLARFRSALATIVDGIGAGTFAARPGAVREETFESCMFCPYDRVCPGDRLQSWERKQGAPELRAYVELAEGDE